MECLGDIISGLFLVAVAIIETRAAKERKKSDVERKKYDVERKKSEARADKRAEESLLSMQMQAATIELADATALALQQGRTNGELKHARELAAEARCAYEIFEKRIAAREVTKI